jgi:ATP-dependent DNA helicase DinG
MAELRRWLLGAEGGRSRARGLRRRLEDLVGERADLVAPLDAALNAARALPVPGWPARLAADPRAAPDEAPNAAEAFLRAARDQVLARTQDARDAGLYDSECDLHPVIDALPPAAEALDRALRRIEEPLTALRDRLAARLEEEPEALEVGDRIRIEAACRALDRRGVMPIRAWSGMLATVQAAPPEPGARPVHVDWLSLERRGGADTDAGMHRHFLDPTLPFATAVAAPAHGVLITSATLRDEAESDEDDPEATWRAAEARTGASHLPLPAIRAAVPSPFDYAARTRCLVVTDVAKENTGQVAAAFQALFTAAGGGALGLFTAIRRLRAHSPLYALERGATVASLHRAGHVGHVSEVAPLAAVAVEGDRFPGEDLPAEGFQREVRPLVFAPDGEESQRDEVEAVELCVEPAPLFALLLGQRVGAAWCKSIVFGTRFAVGRAVDA